MNFKFILILLFIFYIINTNSKIRLITFHYNRPDFLELQCQCINKNLKEKNDYELIVINDAVNPRLRDQITNVCKMYGAECVIYPQDLHHTGPVIEKMRKWGHDGSNGSVRHCQVVQYALDKFGYDHDDIVGIFEGDVFLTRELSLREAMKQYDLIGAVQTDREGAGIEYLWIGLCFFNIKNLPNVKTLCFDLHYHNDQIFLDSGGCTYYYLKNNPEIRVKKHYRLPIAELPRNENEKLESMGFFPTEITFLQSMINYNAESLFISMEYHFDKHFIHYSFSRCDETDNSKLRAFKNYIASILIRPSSNA